MKLTIQQIQTLDTLKSELVRLERKMEDLSIMMDTYTEIAELDKWKECDKLWDMCNKEHIELVRVEAKAWKIDVNLMLDLIFDREHTLNLLR